MSFGDLLSSGRGPGVIGMFMAIIVLVGFGAISIFVFDAELQGEGVSIESVIRRQTEEIETIQHQIETNETIIADSAKMVAQNARIDGLIKQNAADAAKLGELREGSSAAKDSIFAATKALNTYIADYRNYVRRKAIGEKIPELKLKSGESYSDVEIRDVTEIGVEVRHPGGQGRIAFEKLSAEWQERFQFDPEEKAKALAREAAAQKLYESSAETDLAAEEDNVVVGEIGDIKGSEQIAKALREKTIEMARLKTYLGRLQAEAVKVETKDSIDRPKGRSDAQLMLDLRNRIQATESKMYALARQIGSLKTMQPR